MHACCHIIGCYPSIVPVMSKQNNGWPKCDQIIKDERVCVFLCVL